MQTVIDFYDQHPINEAQVLAALKRAGKDPDRLAVTDLFDHDQDHYGGLDAVAALADRAGLGAGNRVLDLCSGLGGPARYLAHEFGAEVVGIDLNAGRAAAAARLTAMVGLSTQVSFVQGDATALPFAAGSFDAAVSQEAFLHIPDKAALFDGIRRVLRPGGRLVFTDWLASPELDQQDREGLAGGIAAMAMHDTDTYRDHLKRAGFRDIEMEDLSAWWRQILRDRLEMYRAMREDTVRLFGEERHRRYVDAYVLFVEMIERGRLGGGRFRARV